MKKSMLAEINALRKVTVAELQEKWLKLYGEPSRSCNRDFLYRRLAWRIQELQRGGLSDRAKERIDGLASDTFTRARTPREALDAAAAANVPESPRSKRDPRLPSSGTVITRTYRGRDLHLHVLDDGFELDGVPYRSLSEAAQAATGSKWNGRLFWGLTARKRRR